MTKEQMISEVGSPFLRPLGIAQTFSILAIVATPFLWIWIDWNIAWKTGLSGLIATILISLIYQFINRIVTNSVNEGLEKLKKQNPDSKFLEKLEKMQQSQNENK